MQILGKYPKGHCYEMRVDVSSLKLRDRLLIGLDKYFVIQVTHHNGNSILLDRPLERATKFHEPIVYDTS